MVRLIEQSSHYYSKVKFKLFFLNTFFKCQWCGLLTWPLLRRERATKVCYHMLAVLPFPPKEKKKTWNPKYYHDVTSRAEKPQIPAKWNTHAQNTIQTHLSKIFWGLNVFSLIRFWIITGEYFMSFLISALITVPQKASYFNYLWMIYVF